jgi:hypothetical protein
VKIKAYAELASVRTDVARLPLGRPPKAPATHLERILRGREGRCRQTFAQRAH